MSRAFFFSLFFLGAVSSALFAPQTADGATIGSCIGGSCIDSAGSCVSGEVASGFCSLSGGAIGTCCLPDSGTGGASGSGSAGGIIIPSDTGLSDASVADILKSLMNWLLGIFGFIAIIGFVISGLQYFFAAGDEKTAETAKRNMQYSIIGIIVALSGFVIIKAVDAALSGTSTTF